MTTTVVRNLTPHLITLRTIAGENILLAAETPCPRLTESEEWLAHIEIVEGEAIPLIRVRRGDVVDLPPYVPGTLWVVSALVAEACPDRDDLVSPARLVRDEQGRIVACAALARPARRP